MPACVPHSREIDLESPETAGTMRRFDSPVSTLVLTLVLTLSVSYMHTIVYSATVMCSENRPKVGINSCKMSENDQFRIPFGARIRMV